MRLLSLELFVESGVKTLEETVDFVLEQGVERIRESLNTHAKLRGCNELVLLELLAQLEYDVLIELGLLLEVSYFLD